MIAKRKDAEDFFINKPYQAIIDGREKGKVFYENIEHLSLAELKSLGILLGNRIGIKFEETPSLRCSLPEGHRVQMNYGDSIGSKIAVSIRIFDPSRKFTLDDFNIEKPLQEKLIEAVINKKAILVVGSTGSGKTQLVNACIRYIPKDDRVLSNEDAYELDFSHLKDVVKTTSNPLMSLAEKGMLTTQQLIDDFGRHKPDRLTMGELNSMNSLYMLQLLNSGHGGVITTIHADDVHRGIEKLVQNIMAANNQDPDFILGSLKEGLGAIIFVTRNTKTYKREVTQALLGDEIKDYQLPASNSLNVKLFNNVLSKIYNILEKHNISSPEPFLKLFDATGTIDTKKIEVWARSLEKNSLISVDNIFRKVLKSK